MIADLITLFWALIRWDYRWSNDVSLSGKTAIVTGGNAGIGKETVYGLAMRGAKVIIACRDVVKGRKTADEIIFRIKQKHLFIPAISVKYLDLASLSSVRQFAQEVLKEENFLHILINNAGLGLCPKSQTEDGFEMHFGVNHLGHFLLTILLLDRLKMSAPARIINVSSHFHYFGKIHFDDINLDKSYGPRKGYAQSKLANVLFTRELAKKLKGSGVTVYSLHPGVIHSGFNRHVINSLGTILGRIFDFLQNIFLRNTTQGAETTLFCAMNESLKDESGHYYSGCRKTQPSQDARNDQIAMNLWALSTKLVGL